MKTALMGVILLATLATARPAETMAASESTNSSRDTRWKEDLEFLARELPGRHIDFFKIISQRKFERELRKLEMELPQLSDVEVVFRLMRHVASLGVAHTWIGFPPKTPAFHGYPFMLHWFADELAVIAASPDHRDIIGARVVNIGSLTPPQAVAAVAPYISHENKAWLYAQSPLLLRNAELLQQLKIARPDGQLRLSLVRPDGQPLALDLAPCASSEPAQWVSIWDALSIPPVLRRKRFASYWYEYLPEARAIYIQYNSCSNIPEYPFANFARELFAFADSNLVERVIVDLRYNGGGDSSVVKPLVNGLKSRTHLKGREHLYVLIGPRTYSSGVFAAVDLRNEADATLVGEPTGGKPNSYGNTPSFRLPNSQMEVWYCTKNFRLIKYADPFSLNPDIDVVLSLKDFIAGSDPALESALRSPLK